ncbi:MAG: deoxyribonuclease IV [Lentisphaerae bacterium]|jgi:deoxyribonuclease IV|nr:deoxyribonuclease IV [Lentisphaerota bacterium]MBT4816070.1 deoxyribonuclease IV [Lentisphaerota bacterium]MBT5609052.1 deoxyribonuclease IV [Lentisphaerota bacterium]MBT7059961.1 deoxyribonuclease IV [Lentisphaerota bacterium]MBT7842450.1 deoxyribonuclease IV [Lentisphaerota bacterium]
MPTDSPESSLSSKATRPFGAHMSIAKGAHLAIDRAAQVEATALQIFVRNQRRWQAPPLTEEAATTFRDRYAESPLQFLCAHAGYLINLASPDPKLRHQSERALEDEMSRAHALGCECLVMHPGSPRDESKERGVERLSKALLRVLEKTALSTVRIALENTAGQGNVLGAGFAELGDIISACGSHPRLAMCFDTCHAFAAGYDLRTSRGVRKTFEEVDECVGLDRLVVLHLNDSIGKLGSHRDRHDHIGKGEIGEAGFLSILQEPLIRHVPGVLETPKDEKTLEEDRVNLALLRRLHG